MSVSNKEKREWAKLLFIAENLPQNVIADKIGVSKVSVNKWAKQDKWEEQKASFTVTREQQLQRLYMQIANLNKAISERDQKYPTPSEADSINKMASAIDKMERESSLADIISVSQRFLNWLRLLDLEKAKEFSGYLDAFIKDNLK
ncbi:MAG TPA: DDE transposase family protein [Bacteroidales bacterium]|nr:DDE transposase family protein [Bacteroidales bacterium]